MTKNPKVIIVGAGRAGVILNYRSMIHNSFDVVAFVDPTLPKTPRPCEEDLELAIDKYKPDVLLIASPTKFHFEQIKTGLAHNLYVIVEKPLVDDITELQELSKLDTNKLTVIYNHKFYPGIQLATKITKSNKYGELKFMYRCMSFTKEYIRMMERGHWSHSLLGGRLFEANPHNLYLLYNFLGCCDLLKMTGFKKNNDKWGHVKHDSFIATFGKPDQSAQSVIRMSIDFSAEGYGKHAPNFLILMYEKTSLYVDYHSCYRLNDRFNVNNVILRIRTIYDNKLRSNIGTRSGHYYFHKKYYDFVVNKKENPVSWDEMYWVERTNIDMGTRLDKENGI